MKKVFLNCMLLLCALIVGSGDLWGDEVTLFNEDFGSIDANTAYSSYDGFSATTSMFSTMGTVKGGSWMDGVMDLRISNYKNIEKSNIYPDVGIRLVKEVSK